MFVLAAFVLAVVLTAFVAAGTFCPEMGDCAHNMTDIVRAAVVNASKRWLIRSPFLRWRSASFAKWALRRNPTDAVIDRVSGASGISLNCVD